MLKRILAISAILGVFLAVAACGSNHSVLRGRVIDGPVSGASVYDSTGTLIGTTDVNGYFILRGTGPYRTTGGTYIPLNADGTPGSPLAAPPMSAPDGINQITPLSTLVANANSADRTAILATLTRLGVDLNTDLSVKNSQNGAAVVLNEMIGALLQQDSSAPATVSSLITSVAAISTSVTPVTTASLITAVTTGLTPAQTTAATNAAQGADLFTGTLPVVPITGSTGSTGGS